jgi:peptidoglycan hydrolase-like protein with peptidoglycan-binding domain
MKLQTVYNSDLKLGTEAISADKELAIQIQEYLIWLGLLSPPADGKFGPISTAAFLEFQDAFKESLSAERGFLGKATAEKIIETTSEEFNRIANRELNLSGNDLATRVVKYMKYKKYEVFTGAKNYNIVYVEGMNEDGSLNGDAPNVFNDRRMVIEIPNKTPILVNSWQATTEPGTHYTMNPISDYAERFGAARIAFGQYKAWQVDTHGTSEPHQALVQVADITVHRDKNKDFIRTGDNLDTGKFFVNQHWGYDYPENNIGLASAGCLVGRRREGHREFMAIIKQDKRYQASSNYIFVTTIIPGDDLVKRFPQIS